MSRFVDKAKARIKFLSPAEGGRATFPPGPEYVTLVRFDGENSPQRSLRCIFENGIDVNGNVTAEIGFIGIGPRGVLIKNKRFVLIEGSSQKIVARGFVTNNVFELPDAPPFVSAQVPRGGDPFQ